MRTLSSALAAAMGAPVQRPAVLAEIGFSTVVRWSSHSTVDWNGHTWTAHAMTLADLQVQALQVRGSLVLDNCDGSAGVLVLGEGVQDKSVRLWGYDAAATGTPDVVWLGEAVGASAGISAAEVRIELRHRTEFVLSPRVQVLPQNGFNSVLPAGTVLRINGIDFKLERP